MIRRARQSDIDVIIDFQRSMALETENLELDENTVGKGVHAIFNDASKGSYIVVDISNEIIGCCMITYEWSDWRNAFIWWLQSLYIKPQWRGKGIFTEMFHFLQDKIIEQDDVCGLRLYVDQTNKHAQKIYAHLGMRDDHYHTFEWMKP